MKIKKSSLLSLSLLSVALQAQAEQMPKDASPVTAQANKNFIQALPVNDIQDFTDASRGLIETVPNLVIKDAQGHVVWDMTSYGFLKNKQAPNSVNPSLWRQSQLNMNYGLFKVIDKVYQIRGFDLSNMTIIEGNTGIIIIDPLVSPETAKAGLDLYYKNRGQKPVKAVIYTHSHIDHFGGVKGVVDPKDVASGQVSILAPDHFLEEAVSENVYAGTAMGRRALYHTGAILAKNERGQVDSGLGKTASLGASTLIPPTDIIKQTGEQRTIDGVTMEFQMAPGTEAPAEMLIYFPQFHLLDAAEDATHTVHNLYTLRGAQVRDAKTWWKVLNTAINRYGDKTEVVIAQHHWPMWTKEQVIPFLENQRDVYKFIHDHTLNLANKGFTPVEIAEQMKLPQSLASKWYDRDYYGSINHDSKAVYQRYLGWYDSNPAHLYPLPPTESAKRYVEFMGGADAVINKAKQSFDKGDYRWVAEVMNQVVFAEPENQAARNLEADALEQLGYQTENATWRNNFLMGAQELRNGVPKIKIAGTATPDIINAMSAEMLLDYLGIRVNSEKSKDKELLIRWLQPDTKEAYLLKLKNSVLIYDKEAKASPIKPDVELIANKGDFANLSMGINSLDDELKNGRVQVQGAEPKLKEFFAMLDEFNLMFNIISPNAVKHDLS